MSLKPSQSSQSRVCCKCRRSAAGDTREPSSRRFRLDSSSGVRGSEQSNCILNFFVSMQAAIENVSRQGSIRQLIRASKKYDLPSVSDIIGLNNERRHAQAELQEERRNSPR